MSRTALIVGALFFALAGFSLVRTALTNDDPLPPPPVNPSATPSPSTPSPSPELEPLPTFAGPKPAVKPYNSIEQLASALDSKGLKCTNLQYLDQDDPTLAEFALCDMGDETRRIDIWRYESKRLRDQWLPGMRGEVDLVYGPNWVLTVVGDPATAPERADVIASAIGGEVVHKDG